MRRVVSICAWRFGGRHVAGAAWCGRGVLARIFCAGSFVVQVHSSQWSHCCAAACTAPLLTGLPARLLGPGRTGAVCRSSLPNSPPDCLSGYATVPHPLAALGSCLLSGFLAVNLSSSVSFVLEVSLCKSTVRNRRTASLPLASLVAHWTSSSLFIHRMR
jgi:hypothetical protein